jgi:hypothetical protein
MDATLTELPVAEVTTAPVPAAAMGAPRAHRPGRRKKAKRCEDCFFFQRQLCALERKEPCPTFREAHPDGLRPPRQLSFAFRVDRKPEFLPPVAR